MAVIEEGGDQVTSRSPFQPQLFCDSVRWIPKIAAEHSNIQSSEQVKNWLRKLIQKKQIFLSPILIWQNLYLQRKTGVKTNKGRFFLRAVLCCFYFLSLLFCIDQCICIDCKFPLILSKVILECLCLDIFSTGLDMILRHLTQRWSWNKLENALGTELD